MKKVREGYKMSELGEIPEEWSIVKLSDLSQKIGDGLHGTPKYVENSDYYFINGNNLVCGKVELYEDTKMVSEEDYIKNNKDLNENSLLISLNGTIGNVAYYNNEKIMLGKSSGYINLKGNINKKYIYYVLKTNTVLEYFNKELTGTTIKNLSLSTLRNTPIPLPNIREQEKIALILSTVDEQIDNVDALIEKNKELKKGLMQTLLTKGIGHTKFKKTEIGEIPEAWEVKKLGDIFKLSSGNFLSQKNIVEGCYPVYGGNGVNGYHNEYMFQESKLVIGRVGAKCGCVCLSQSKAWITDNALYISEKMKEFDDKYMYYLLDSINLNSYANQNAQPVISGQKIYGIYVAFPNINEQIKITKILSQIDEKIEEYENKKQKLEELKKGLMQKLLTGSIRVF